MTIDHLSLTFHTVFLYLIGFLCLLNIFPVTSKGQYKLYVIFLHLVKFSLINTRNDFISQHFVTVVKITIFTFISADNNFSCVYFMLLVMLQINVI
jgi:hypothetical protein